MWRCQKVPKFDFLSQLSKIIGIFLNFFFIEGHQFRRTFFIVDIFLIISIFKSFHFLEWWPIFDTAPLHQFSKFKNDFLSKRWFLGKNLSYFVPPAWKLENQYYHRPLSIIAEDNLHTMVYIFFWRSILINRVGDSVNFICQMVSNLK